nr:unnamed protein product [Callosobruchus analis]
MNFIHSKSFKELTLLLEVSNILLVRSCLYFNRRECYLTYNCLLYLIERRKFYGVRTALGSKFAIDLRHKIVLHTIIALTYNVITFLRSIYYLPTFKNVIYATTSFLAHNDAASIVIVIINALQIYLELVTSLYKTVEETLKAPSLESEDLSFKLKIWQQYYLAIVNNYNRNILAPSNIILVITQFSFIILLIAFGLIYYVIGPQRDEYDLSTLVDSTLFILLSTYINFLADNVTKSVSENIDTEKKVSHWLVNGQHRHYCQNVLLEAWGFLPL